MVGGVLVSNVLNLAKATSVTTLIITLISVALFIILIDYSRRPTVPKLDSSQIPALSRQLPWVGPLYWYYKAYTEGIWETWLCILNKYPSCFYLWIFSQLWVIISSPKDLESVFLSDNATDKGAIYAFFGNKSEGIFTAEGDNWRKLRSLLNPAFHTKLLAQFLETMVVKADVLMKILDAEVDKTIDISEYVGRWTLDVICGTQMGVKTTELEDNKYDFLACSAKTTDLIIQRMFSPLLHSDFIYKSTNLYQKIKTLCKPMHNFAKMIITRRKEFLEEEYINPKEKREQIYLDGVLTFFSDADEQSLIRKVTDILIAGSDTTQVVTSYTLLLLGMYPDIQEKIYQEQCNIIANHSADLTISTLARMKYLEMVIKETLRLYTVPGIVRKLTKPVKLENGVLVPTGSSVYMSMYKVHRNPKIWAHPNEFYPDHFLPENVATRPKYSFIPFSAGPRNCPGMAFAYLSVKTIISNFVRNYKIHSDEKFSEFKHKMCLMLERENGYPIKLTRR